MNLSKLLGLLAMLTLLIGSVSLSMAQSDTNDIIWNSTFYNNSYLGEPAVFSRQDASLAFDWGSGSPDARIDDDNFSARFSTTFLFTADFYRFRVVADDGVRVIIDNSITIIDTFFAPQPSQPLIADVDIAPGRHTIQVGYREVSGLALLQMGWIPIENPGNTITIPANDDLATTLVSSSISPASNWVASYYANPSLAGTPSAIVSETSPSHNWGVNAPFPSMPADNFSAQWTSDVYLDGTYDITVRADDGVRVFVDGVAYIDEWHLATPSTYSARFTVTPGNHSIVIQYYEADGIAFLDYELTAVSRGTTGRIPVANSALPWLVQYYNNAGLSGTPVLTQTEDRVSRTWGTGAPISSMSPDNFSVRFISNPVLEAGTYLITVRADDGVRVYIDDTLYINEWHLSNGTQRYTATVNLSAGSHRIVIEYYENAETAFIEYSLDPFTDTPVVDTTLGTGATATVTASRLNVREQPNVFAPILTKINRGETYAILGQNSTGNWIQLNVDGLIGWVNERYTDEFNYINVPVSDETFVDVPDVSGNVLTTTANLNMRRGPELEFDVIRIIPENTTVSVEGRTIDADWWQVRYGGNVGWVTEAFVRLAPNIDTNDVVIIR